MSKSIPLDELPKKTALVFFLLRCLGSCAPGRPFRLAARVGAAPAAGRGWQSRASEAGSGHDRRLFPGANWAPFPEKWDVHHAGLVRYRQGVGGLIFNRAPALLRCARQGVVGG
jgi:hypothetical protein